MFARPILARRFIGIQEHLPNDCPQWLIDGIQYGIECCRIPYNPKNKEGDWNATTFIDDRHPDSLRGGLREAYYFLSGIVPLTDIEPCMKKKDQVVDELDARRKDGSTDQVKGVQYLSSGGQVKVYQEWFTTTADNLIVVVDSNRLILAGPTSVWREMMQQTIDRAEKDEPGWYTEKLSRAVPIEAEVYNKVLTIHQLPDWMDPPKE